MLLILSCFRTHNTCTLPKKCQMSRMGPHTKDPVIFRSNHAMQDGAQRNDVNARREWSNKIDSMFFAPLLNTVLVSNLLPTLKGRPQNSISIEIHIDRHAQQAAPIGTTYIPSSPIAE